MGDRQSPLRRALDQAAAESGCPMKDLTVLSAHRDPFRLDTDARHRDGKWLADTAAALGLGDRRIHLRGLHYMVLGRPKPDGSPYENTDADWTWLSEDAGKAARWLGYIPFDQITDQRNAEPEIRQFSRREPWPYLTVGLDVQLPAGDDILPEVVLLDFDGTQPCHLVLFGEKSSLSDVLGPVAARFGADLYLPTGEISDTLMYRMATSAVADGRPMVVLCFSDADPAGWQMPVSIARKLQAFKALGTITEPASDAYGNRTTRTLDLAGMEFQVRRVALTPGQVREYGLPSTPLKPTEKRADKWRAAMGVEQTEIDALASLRPALLRQIAETAIAPFFDDTLSHRVAQARAAWLGEAREIVTASLDSDQLARIRADAAGQLDQMRQQIAELNDALRIDVDDFDLPPIVVPEPETAGSDSTPLLDSRWSFAEQCRALIASKDYQTASGGA